MGDTMMNLERKELPLKSFITTFECVLKEPQMDKELKKVIDKYGDKQDHKTNVKAQMTDWKMWHEPSFKKLAIIVLNMSKQMSHSKYNFKLEPQISTLWGMKYKSGEKAITHDHWPSLWSFVYYITAPKGAPGLFFPEMGEQGAEKTIKPGLLIFFEGHVKHGVRPTKFKGSRYAVSGNIKEKF